MLMWWGSLVECWSAFARLRREGIFPPRDEEQARLLLARLATAWTEILPSQAVRDHAVRALQWHPLRAADTLQLAAALVWVQGQPIGQPFVCLDHRLRAAAQREGFFLYCWGSRRNRVHAQHDMTLSLPATLVGPN